MHVNFQCPHCRATLEAEANIMSQDVPCPGCGKTVRTPASGIRPGMMLDDLRIEASLGRGSMGHVYLATQVSLDRRVAVKILSMRGGATPVALAHFQQEVRTLAKLTHPNLVTAFAAGECRGAWYLAMSYVRGETIAARIARQGWLPEQEALIVTLCVARALRYAWDRHAILHRDIKPANVMVDEDGEIRLMDLGLATSLIEQGRETREGSLVGTPHYMSPEQARGAADLDFRTDMYALGATLFHMATGAPPYAGKSVKEIIRKQMEAPVPSLRERNPSLTDATQRLVEWMMAKDPARRPVSWDHLVAEIEGILQHHFPDYEAGRPLPAEQAAEPDPLPEPPRVRRGFVVAMMLTAASAGAWAGWWFWGDSGAAQRREAAAARLSALPETGREFILEKTRPLLNNWGGTGDAAMDALRALESEADRLLREGKREEAASLYRSYSGPRAEETAAARAALADLIDTQPGPPQEQRQEPDGQPLLGAHER
jgi:eukaryotic-like serine/threonine-protein kinase